jgi:hypothetical protein
MKNWFKKVTGIAKLEKERADALVAAEIATKAAVEAKEAEELAKSSPKERATRKKEPWVAVLDTHVNKDNVRNGFFELDWNEHFVLKLKQEGYGEEGDRDEEIVDRWFRELCANVVVADGYENPINTGIIDINEVKRNNR